MLTIVEGYQGDGKTLYVVRKVLQLVEGPRPAARVFANLHIDHPNASREGWDFLLAPDAPPGIYVWDEAARAWDSRRSMSHTLTMLQGATEERKNARDVWLTTQLRGMLDVRIRRMATFGVKVRGLFKVKRTYSKDDDSIIRREHPRAIVIERWRGPDFEKQDPKKRLGRIVLPWRFFAPYADRYDTTESIEVAAHLAAGRDFYRDNRRDSA